MPNGVKMEPHDCCPTSQQLHVMVRTRPLTDGPGLSSQHRGQPYPSVIIWISVTDVRVQRTEPITSRYRSEVFG